MEVLTHRAFDYVCVQLKVNPGDIVTLDPIVQNRIYSHPLFDHVTVQTKNNNTVQSVETGERFTVYEGDSIYTRNFATGEYLFLNENYFELFCIGPFVNEKHLPLLEKFEPFKLLEGQTVNVSNGKRIFMMEGALEIAGKNYKGVNRLHFTTGNRNVTAVKNTYGLYVK